MGVITGVEQMLSDLSGFFALFSSFFYFLPTVCRLLISFGFGAVVLLGLLNMIVRSA